MKYTLNIGLHESHANAVNTPRVCATRKATWLACIERSLGPVCRTQDYASNDGHEERGVAVEFDTDEAPASVRCVLNKWCRMFRQDCVALWSFSAGEGALVGPKAAAWGDFKPEFFVSP